MIGVCVTTYNHEKYIKQCIDSVLSQKCSELIRIYVGNDCSKDSTDRICQTYGEKIIYINRPQNLGLVANTMDLLDRMRNDGCDYIAMLDGDDYWCDENKLQKQINYFNKHPEYGF